MSVQAGLNEEYFQMFEKSYKLLNFLRNDNNKIFNYYKNQFWFHLLSESSKSIYDINNYDNYFLNYMINLIKENGYINESSEEETILLNFIKNLKGE
jgi:hypothetical protein